MNSVSLKDKLNRPIHDLRISVIDRCNFRCPYCMPEEGAKTYSFLEQSAWLTYEEITRLVRLFVQMGVKKIRLTGGEPLLRPNLVDLIKQLSLIPQIEDLALTTNGSLLAQHARALKDAGLHRITVSLDSLDARLFRLMSGNRGSVQQILEGIQAAEKAGFSSIKINVVVQRGVNDHSVLEMVGHFKGTGHVLRFIEFMDVGNCNHWDSKYVLPSAKIVELINEKYPLEPLESGYFGEVASRYRYKDGAEGEIGFISSVSQPFCGTCTRARLSADGQIVTCLFADHGKDVRALMRAGASDSELLDLIRSVWKNREDRYSELRHELIKDKHPPHKIEMFQIGG